MKFKLSISAVQKSLVNAGQRRMIPLSWSEGDSKSTCYNTKNLENLFLEKQEMEPTEDWKINITK